MRSHETCLKETIELFSSQFTMGLLLKKSFYHNIWFLTYKWKSVYGKLVCEKRLNFFFDFSHGNLTIGPLTEIHLQTIFVLHPLIQYFALQARSLYILLYVLKNGLMKKVSKIKVIGCDRIETAIWNYEKWKPLLKR